MTPAEQGARPDVEDMDLSAMAEEITTLAGHIAAATCRLLELLAAFDAGGGWHDGGIRSCAQWLTWRCGLSSSTAHEHVRVAHALAGLPVVRAAFGRGELSYSKARALTRVATPDSEAQLVSVATHATAGQLDRLCSGLGRAGSNNEVLDPVDPTEGDETDGQSSAEDTRQNAAGPNDTHRRESSAEDSGDADSRHSDPTPGDRADPDAPADLPGDRDRDISALVARSDAAALMCLARHALATPPADTGSSTPIRLIVHTTDQTLTALATPSSADQPPNRLSSAQDAGLAEPTPTVAILDAGPGISLLPLGPDTLRRLACESLVEPATHPDDDRPPRVEHRFATARQRRALLRRDGGCSFPGCPRRRHLHAHHRVEWSQGGSTSMDNLLLICQHHHKLVHEGGWQLQPHTAPDGHRGWIAIGPDGQRRTAAPPTTGNVRTLPTTHGAVVAPDTVTGQWRGERLELDYAVSVLAPRASAS